MHDSSAPITYRGSSETAPAPDWVDLLPVADPPNLAVLSVLRDAGRLTIEQLADRIADREHDAANAPGDGGDVTPATLYHVHLPTLAESGLVEVAEDAARTAVGPGPAFEGEAVLELERAVASGAVDETLRSALEEPRRRRAIGVLAAVDGPTEVDDLAAAISAGGGASPAPGGSTPDVAVMLHHVDLPKLAAAGVVDYDPEAGVVTYEGLPDVLSAIVASR